MPSTVQQISTYLSQSGGVASSTALYLISSGGNDITFANDNFNNSASKQAYITSQVASLVAGIASLQALGAKNILVNNLYGGGPGTLINFYNQTLVSDLLASHVNFTLADIQLLVNNVEANPTNFGFTDATVLPGVPGLQNTSSACVGSGSGWGQFCGNTTEPQTDFAHLRSADAEQTSFFSDDQHFSAAGQLIEANFEFNLLESAVPEPSTWAMMILGFAGIGFMGYRRKQNGSMLA